MEQQNFPPATIPLAELTTVIDDSGQWRTRAVYHVKNRQRQFLPVVLPENTRILSILVDSQPARTVKQQLGEANVSLIPLPAAGIADLAIPVELVLEGNLEQHWTSIWLRKRVQIPAPVVLTIKASEEFGIPVQHTTWKLSTPEDLVLKPVSGANTNLNASSQSEVSQFALQTRLAEMLELSQILTQSRLTLDQKLRAKQNLLELKGQIEGEYSGYSSSYEFRPDSPSPHQLNRQTELLDQVEQQLQNFSQSQTELTIITEEQASGRKYIMSNNGLILEQNQQSAPASESRLDFSGSQSDSQSRIRLPVNTPAAPGQKKEESPAGRLMSRSSRNEAEDRSSLMQENQKQNLMYQQQVQPGYPLRTHTIQNNTKVDMSTPVDAFSVVPTPGEKIPGKDKLATAAAPAVSLRAGGLSLPVELPVYGQVQVFSKVGGNPQLEVEVHSRTARFHSLGWLWTIGIALLLVLCGKEMRQGNHQRVTSLLLLLGGLVGFAFLPGFAGGLGLAVTITVVFLLNFSGKNLPQTPKTTSQQQ